MMCCYVSGKGTREIMYMNSFCGIIVVKLNALQCNLVNVEPR